MIAPCPGAVNCPPADNEALANLSAELPDTLRFFGYSFFPGGSTFCAAETQAEADICDPPPPANPPLPVVYSSGAASCTVDCGDGTTETYEVVAGSFVAMSQSEANAMAAAFACLLAQILCNGGSTQTFTNARQRCTVNCPDGSSLTYTTEAGFFTALTQMDADAQAYSFACEIAALLCPQPPGPDGIPPGGGGGTPPAPRTVFYGNTAQQCQAVCPDGVSTFTFTAEAGMFLRESRLEANTVANSYACRMANNNRICLANIGTDLCVGEFYSDMAALSGNLPGVTWSLTGTLPPGLIRSANAIAGTPTASGSYTFTLRAASNDGRSVFRTYTMTVREITPSTLPDGNPSTAYAVALTAVGFNNPTWSITSGVLPDGLVLNPHTGVISGTPTMAGDFFFTVSAGE